MPAFHSPHTRDHAIAHSKHVDGCLQTWCVLWSLHEDMERSHLGAWQQHIVAAALVRDVLWMTT